ncbi:MAG: DUF4129 domain-containing protein [Candidatus Dormiibacterota bacterium]
MRSQVSSSGPAEHDLGRRKGSRWLLAVAVVALLAVVALSVRAHYAVGPTGVPNKGPGAVTLGSIVRLLLVVALAAFELVLVLALVFAPWRRFRDLGTSGPAVPWMRRRAALRMVAPAVLLLAAEVLVFVLLAKRRSGAPSAPPGLKPAPPPPRVPNLFATVAGATVPEATALAAVVGLVVVLAILGARYRSRRKGAAVMADPSELPQELSSAIDQSLSELAAGADPRQAVIAVYERMERVLAGVGLPAQAFETPLEYLERALTRLEASRGALVRLTDLFETARFSTHPVGSGMRSEAVEALGKLRAELAG